ncbi:MAG TPA: hypothetical protein VLX61_17905 [Anaerolineales bacterium]|nr:hypothetical protein [Anaerolineales bacterium]
MKNRTLLIIFGVILLCCCVVVIAAAAAYPLIRSYLNGASQNLIPSATTPTPETATTSQPPSGPADGGLGDPTLKADVWNAILKAERGRGCDEVSSTAVAVVQQPDSNGVWVEDWSATVCGNEAVFEITFSPDPNGGTNYDIKQK